MPPSSYQTFRLLDDGGVPSTPFRFLNNNQLSGTIPSTIGQLTNLKELCGCSRLPIVSSASRAISFIFPPF
jgi:hypothetical protein